uniref:ArsC/Spx/MgsR family protein n=1 Tax=Lactococcus garvieae TaxID=1363 RepID=UPI00359C2676
MKANFEFFSQDINLLGSKCSRELYLFKKKDEPAVQKVETWLNKHNLAYKIITPCTINKSIVIQMLYCSEKGFSEILVSRVKAAKTWQSFPEVEIEKLTVPKMIQEILKNPYLLKNPILFDEEKLSAGFNVEEIRKFIPKAYRMFENRLRTIE